MVPGEYLVGTVVRAQYGVQFLYQPLSLLRIQNLGPVRHNAHVGSGNLQGSGWPGRDVGPVLSEEPRRQNSYRCWTLVFNLENAALFMSSVMAQAYHLPWRETSTQALWTGLSLKTAR